MTQPISLGDRQSFNAGSHLDLEKNTGAEGAIVLLAETGVVFQGLLQATQQSFPNFTVTLSDQLPEADDDPQSVRIVLVHASLSEDLAGVVLDCHKQFPGTPIALMVDDTRNDVPELGALLDAKLVQGLLPFSLQLNVWLAAIWLLVNGGEYFPIALMQGPGGRLRRAGGMRMQLESQDSAAIKSLTSRERQVLELVSQGLQNKLIAAKMELSEHTVKVHVHNVIRKLKVHNRTQAAAALRTGSMRHRSLQSDDDGGSLRDGRGYFTPEEY
ncbi:MAG TPA: response regulator transcription factor [Arsenicitalea sp.]|jgi:DNA-binding NarL/FixJ family response regulator|nr:response regulator transcription factor [Arsenicitalea sp.]